MNIIVQKGHVRGHTGDTATVPVRSRQRAWESRNPKRTRFIKKKHGAKIEGVPFSLRFEDVVWPELCPVLGIQLDYTLHGGGRGVPRDNSPSFDRLDSTRGYVAGNVIIISHRANTIKHNATPAELRAVADFFGRRDTALRAAEALLSPGHWHRNPNAGDR